LCDARYGLAFACLFLWLRFGLRDRLWLCDTSLDGTRWAGVDRHGVTTFLGTCGRCIVGAPTRFGPRLNAEDGLTSASLGLCLGYWFRHGLWGTRCDIDTAVLVNRLWTTAFLEAFSCVVVATVAALRESESAIGFRAPDTNLILWLWYWFRYGLCGTRCEIDATVLVDWLLAATLLEAGFLPGIAAKTTLRPRLDAYISLAYTNRLWQ